jgi:polyhydroxyalkanoate synthesis regulator phasin
MRTKQLLLGLAGGGLLLVGVLAGIIFGDNLRALAAGSPSAQATPNSRASYCQLYIQTLASDLGVSPDKLKSANKDAAQKVIDQMASDGKITADQKTRMTERLQKYADSPCAFVDVGAAHHGPGDRIAKLLDPARAAAATAVAGALHISVDTLKSDLRAGQTIPQIAAAQKVNIGDVNSAYLNAIKTQLSSAVSAKQITQAQSDALYNRVQQAVQNGHYPLLGGGDHTDQPAQP